MAHVAVVTGGASGIGRAVSEGLVRRGSHVVIADINAQGASEVATMLSSLGPGTASGVALDVRDADAVAAVYQQAQIEHGRLDAVFNNAGVAVGGEVEELTVAHWDRVIDVNLRGVVYGVAAAYPLMIKQGFGHIVNTASLAGLIPAPLLTPYSMTKHGVVGLSLALRAEARPFGVKVTAVCPGFVDTPMLDGLGPEDLPQTSMARRAQEMQASAERQLGRPYPVDKLARDVLRGVDRNKALIVTPLSARALWRLHRLAPSLISTVGARGVALVRKRMDSATPQPRQPI